MYTTALTPGGAIPPQVAVGGRLGTVLYFGDAHGYPGYYQVTFRIPSVVRREPLFRCACNRPSNEVTIACAEACVYWWG